MTSILVYMARRRRDLDPWQNELCREWMKRVLKPPKGTGTLTQAQIAAELGMTQASVSAFLGERQGLSIVTALDLADLVGEEPAVLFPRKRKRRRSISEMRKKPA